MLMTAIDTNTLPGMQIALADRGRNALGALGEKWTQLMLEKSGYVVATERRGQQRGDLRVISRVTGEIFQVEVKTARRAKDGKWRFLLWKKGQQDHNHADVVILLTVTVSGYVVPFIVPVSEIAQQHQAVITSHPLRYRGKLASYRQPSHRLDLTIQPQLKERRGQSRLSTPAPLDDGDKKPCPDLV